MATSKPVTFMCLYRVAKGKQAAFRRLLGQHWPALRRAGFASEEPALVLRGTDRQGRSVFVETFEWANARALAAAHRSPEVMALWGPMGELAPGRRSGVSTLAITASRCAARTDNS